MLICSFAYFIITSDHFFSVWCIFSYLDGIFGVGALDARTRWVLTGAGTSNMARFVRGCLFCGVFCAGHAGMNILFR